MKKLSKYVALILIFTFFMINMSNNSFSADEFDGEQITNPWTEQTTEAPETTEGTRLYFEGISGKLRWTIDVNFCLNVTGVGDYVPVNVSNMTDVPEWYNYRRFIKKAKINVSGITSLKNMFAGCSSLTEIESVNLDKSNVINMDGMFVDCSSLEYVDMSNWNISNVSSATGLFDGCVSLSTVKTPINLTTDIKLPEGEWSWRDADGNYYKSLPINTSESIVITKTDKVADTVVEINGFQISNVAEGFRTVYSVSTPMNNVVSAGLIYGLTDYSAADSMIVDSNSKYVYDYKATELGKLDDTFSDMESATSYVMTMKFAGVSQAFFEAPVMVRAYAKLSDGTYVYSNIVTTRVFDIADILYTNNWMNNEVAHKYLYTNILNLVDNEYKEIEFVYGNSLVTPFDK